MNLARLRSQSYSICIVKEISDLGHTCTLKEIHTFVTLCEFFQVVYHPPNLKEVGQETWL